MLTKNIMDNITLPIVVAPMFLVSSEALVVGACINGVMAAFPLTNARTLSDCDTILHSIKTKIERAKKENPSKKIAPWMVNMIVHSTYARFEEELALVRKYQPPVVITALGSPKRVVATVQAYGGQVWADVSSVKFARKAVETGIDGLILLCAGAGGHTGSLSPFAFVEAVRTFFHKTLIVSGGISNVRTIKAIQILGADLAYMGTAFMATEESKASEAYKRELIRATIDDIITTDKITGVKANFLQSSLDKVDLENYSVPTMNFNERYSENTTQKAWKDIWSAGHGVGEITQIQSVTELIESLQKAYQKLT